MKVFEKNVQEKFLVYCETPNDDATIEQIITKCSYNFPSKRIDLNEFIPDTKIVSNLEKIFCHSNGEVSMVLGRAFDVNNVIIPNTYEVRVIGHWHE